jgi:hypothetical protein
LWANFKNQNKGVKCIGVTEAYVITTLDESDPGQRQLVSAGEDLTERDKRKKRSDQHIPKQENRIDHFGPKRSNGFAPSNISTTSEATPLKMVHVSKSAKFGVTRSSSVRSGPSNSAGFTANKPLSSSIDPKILTANTFKKNSYLIRKHSFKSYMTENIPKLMQSYSLI